MYVGKHYTSKVKCVDGMCKARNSNIIDSCHYICGSKTCDHLKPDPGCKDNNEEGHAENCPGWAKQKYCKGQYEAFMKKNCKKSCGYC